MSLYRESTDTTNIATDANVVWISCFRDRIRNAGLSPYEKNSNVKPFWKDLGDFLEGLNELKYDVEESMSFASDEVGRTMLKSLSSIVDSCINDCLEEHPGFDFGVAYSCLLGIFEELKGKAYQETEQNEGESEGVPGFFSMVSAVHSCPYCKEALPKYPGCSYSRCPNCNNVLKMMNDSIITQKESRYKDYNELKPHIISIQEEVKKRTALNQNVVKMAEGKLDRFEALKASLSCLTRVVVQEQIKPGSGVLESIGEPLMVDIMSLLSGKNIVAAQKRVGGFFSSGK